MQRKLLALLLAFLMSCSTISIPVVSAAEGTAEELALEDLLFQEIAIVTSASFFKAAKTKSPGYAYVIGNSKIEYGSPRTLGELFDVYLPGVSMSWHRWTGPIIGTRGLSVDTNMHTLVMLDGADLNQRRSYGYSTELNAPFLADIDRIEFVQGPGSTVHGSGAINGFVNIIPKNGADYKGFDVRVEGGVPDNMGKAEIGYGKEFRKGHDLYLYGGYVQSEGFTPPTYTWNSYEQPEPWMGFIGNVTNVKKAGVDPKLQEFQPSFKFAAYYRWDKLSINYHFINLDDCTNHFANWFDGGSLMFAPSYDMGWHHGEMALQPKYAFSLSDTEEVVLSANLKMDDAGFYMKGRNPNGEGSGNIAVSGETLARGQAVYKKENADLGFLRSHSMAAGVNYGQRNFNFNPHSFFMTNKKLVNGWESGDMLWNEYAAFGEDTFVVNNELTGLVGLRLDGVKYPSSLNGALTDGTNVTVPITDTDKNHLAPRIAFAYSVDDKNTVRASYQQGFLWPSAGQTRAILINNASFLGVVPNLVGPTGGVSSFLVPFDAETLDSYELNYSRKIEDKRIDFDANVYYNTLSNLNVYSTAANTNIFISKFASTGLELICSWQVTDKTKWEINYGLSKPVGYTNEMYAHYPAMVDEELKNWISYPTHSIKTNVTQTMLDGKLVLHGNAEFFSGAGLTPRRDVASLDSFPGVFSGYTPEREAYTSAYKDPAVWVNLAARYGFSDSLFAKLVVKNVFAGRNIAPNYNVYYPAEAIPADGQGLTQFHLVFGYRL